MGWGIVVMLGRMEGGYGGCFHDDFGSRCDVNHGEYERGD